MPLDHNETLNKDNYNAPKNFVYGYNELITDIPVKQMNDQLRAMKILPEERGGKQEK